MTSPTPGAHSRFGKLNWREVWVLYCRELRAALREKMIVINSILIPVCLYPLLLWAVLSGVMFVMGQTEAFTSRIVVRNWPAGHSALRKKFEANQQITLVSDSRAVATLDEEIKNGNLEALVDFAPASAAGASLARNFAVQLTYNQSRERSLEAHNRIKDILEEYRADWLKREGRNRGIDEAAWQDFTLASRNVASKKEMGAFILGMLAPVMFVVMVAIGCFYPAVDSVAGERERNTWETLMSTAASRLGIVAAKYLYVVTLGGVAGILNLTALLLTIRPVFAPLMGKAGKVLECNIPPTAIPVAFISALLLAGFVAAGMMIFASFARTFREGQAMVTPFYMLVMVPVMFLQAPGLKLSLGLALVPIVNVTLMVRDALSGKFQWLPIIATLLVSLITVGVCLRLAAYILQFEDVVMGSYSGNLVKFIRGRILGHSHPKPAISNTP